MSQERKIWREGDEYVCSEGYRWGFEEPDPKPNGGGVILEQEEYPDFEVTSTTEERLTRVIGERDQTIAELRDALQAFSEAYRANPTGPERDKNWKKGLRGAYRKAIKALK